MPDTPTRMYKNRDRAVCGPPNSAAIRSTWKSPRRPQFSAPRITTIKVRTLRAVMGRAPGGHAAAVEVKACRPTAVPLRLQERRSREDRIREPPADRLLCRRSPREPERTGLVYERAEPRAGLCAARDQVGPAQRHRRCSLVAGDAVPLGVGQAQALPQPVGVLRDRDCDCREATSRVGRQTCLALESHHTAKPPEIRHATEKLGEEPG